MFGAARLSSGRGAGEPRLATPCTAALTAQVSVMVATKLELALDQARHETAAITRQSSQVATSAALQCATVVQIAFALMAVARLYEQSLLSISGADTALRRPALPAVFDGRCRRTAD